MRFGNRSRPAVALTFDDGPGPETPRLLDALGAARATATFFLIGSRVKTHAESVARIAEGHEIGSHSWGHESPGRSYPEVFRDLLRTSLAIHRAAGARPHWFRPPYAKWTPGLVRMARLAGMGTVTWEIDSRDWEGGDPRDVAEVVLRSIQAGSIVLFHDDGGPAVDAVPLIARDLRTQGFELVTVSELLAAG